MRLMTIAARVISYAVGATYGNIEMRVITAFAAKRRLQIEILQSRSVYSTSLPWVVFSQAFTYKMYWYIRKLTCNINGSTNVTYIIFTLIYKYLLRRQQRLRSVVLSTSVCVCVCVSVCLSVCLSARIPPEPHARSLPIFLRLLPIAVARFSSGGVTKFQKGQFWGFFPIENVFYKFHYEGPIWLKFTSLP